MLSVIRIALKWLIGLLCGYVITTPGVTQAHHIRHQSEGCVLMIYRLLLVKVLHSHNDNSKWDLSHLDGLSRYMFQKCLFISFVFSWKATAIATCTHHKARQMLYFSGCSLHIPVGLPLFKLWRETQVW